MAIRSIIRGGRMLALVVLAVVLTGMTLQQDETVVERVSFSPTAGGDGFVIRIHAGGLINAYWAPQVAQDNVVEFKVFNAVLAPSFQHDDPIGIIEDVEVEAEDRNLVFQFHLVSDVEVDVAAYRDRLSDDVLVSLRGPELELEAAPPVATTTEMPSDRAETSDPGPAGPPEGQPVVLASGDRWRLDTIVIDAGHGAHDPGTADHGVVEKDVTLAVALKLGEYIERYLDGVNVVYIREGDGPYLKPGERGRFANEVEGKLFISIHANWAPSSAARGAETFILGPARTEHARRVMERENRIVRADGQIEEQAAPPEEDLLVRRMTHSAYMRNSEVLADLIQRQFAERVNRTNRGVKQAGFEVLWTASMPAVLVELGFLSNPAEARFLASEQGQTYMASAIFRAVREYRERYERGIALSN